MLRHSAIMDTCTRKDNFTMPLCMNTENRFQEQSPLHVMVDINLPSENHAEARAGVFEELQCSSPTRQKSNFKETLCCENPGIAFILGIGEPEDDDDSDSDAEFGSDLCDDFVWELELYPLQEHCVVADICKIKTDSSCHKQPDKSETVIDFLAHENTDDYVLSMDCVDGNRGAANGFINKLEEVNRKWNMQMKDVDHENKRLDTKVHFAPQECLETVHFVEDCDRTSPWYQYAVDRSHFQQRILEMEAVLSPCFESGHRAAVFKRLNHQP